jgi:hypothetical protein
MRADELISFKAGLLRILDYGRLESASGFNSNYLHIAERC